MITNLQRIFVFGLLLYATASVVVLLQRKNMESACVVDRVYTTTAGTLTFISAPDCIERAHAWPMSPRR